MQSWCRQVCWCVAAGGWFAACAAPPPPPAGAWLPPAPSEAVAQVATGSATTPVGVSAEVPRGEDLGSTEALDGDEVAAERALRQDLASAVDPTAAALALAEWLAAGERHREALTVVLAALRSPEANQPLLHWRAGVLQRDLGQREAACRELREAWRLAPLGALPAVALGELAEVAWLTGDAATARVALTELRVAPDAAKVDAASVAALEQALASGREPVLLPRDWFGNLRGGDLAARRAAFAHCTRGGRDDPSAQRALAIACGDADPELRAAAVAQVPLDSRAVADFVAAALADPAPAVRLALVARLPELAAALGDAGRAAAAQWLGSAIALEAVPEVFAAMHRTLCLLVPELPTLPQGAAQDPEARAAAVAAWRARGLP
ncbi:MAG: hypothetical protein JNK49_10940 [Planctomycetes bacterium]|nr:hypothetical protein [Planctomycetota bacterium]